MDGSAYDHQLQISIHHRRGPRCRYPRCGEGHLFNL